MSCQAIIASRVMACGNTRALPLSNSLSCRREWFGKPLSRGRQELAAGFKIVFSQSYATSDTPLLDQTIESVAVWDMLDRKLGVLCELL